MTDASKDGEKQLPTSGSRELQTSDKVSSPQHVRSDSAYSVDSFVIDAASNWSDAADDMLDKAATQAQRIRTMGEHASSPSPQQQQQETIGYARLNNGQSSSDSGKPPPPAHPFFNAPFYNSHWNGNDSDVSDGSFIYNHTPQKPQQAAPTATPAAPNDQRDRFPSFDSMGSSGSLVQNVVSRSTQPAGPTISSPAPPTSNSQTILPYHERRKLMQQRQNKHQHQHHRPHQQQPQHYRQQQQGQQHQYQQQQQQHQHQNRDQTPPRPGRHPQLPTPQPFYAVPQLPFVTPPHHQQLGFAPFPPHPFGFLPPPPPHLFPFPSPGMPSIVPLQPFSPHPADYHRPQDPHLLQQQQPFMMGERQPTTNIGSKAPSSHYARPPVQKLQPYGSGTGDHMLQWQTSSSLDSSDGMEQRNVCRQDVRFASAGSGPPLLRNHYSDPPPPPPPQLPTTHIRQDSAGSISSLGSLDRSGRENNLAVRDERSFLERLRPWSSPPKQYNVSDFHRKNQDFLSTMERKSSRNSPSPRPISRRYAVMIFGLVLGYYCLLLLVVG